MDSLEEASKAVIRIGIDLGTFQTSAQVAFPGDKQPRRLRPDSDKTRESISSQVVFDPKAGVCYPMTTQMIQQVKADKKLRRFVLKRTKLVMGKLFKELTQDQINFFKSKNTELVAGDDGFAVIKITKKISKFPRKEKTFIINPKTVAVQLVRRILEEVVQLMTRPMEGIPWIIVVGKPAKYSATQSSTLIEAVNEAIGEVFKEAKFTRVPETTVKLIDEPVAASLSYLDVKNQKVTEGNIVLIIDCGGGTTDVAIVKYEDGEYKVLASDGDNHLGGMNIDKEIAERFEELFKNSSALCPYLLMLDCETIKINFGEQHIKFGSHRVGKVEKKITRDDFSSIVQRFMARVIFLTEKVIKKYAEIATMPIHNNNNNNNISNNNNIHSASTDNSKKPFVEKYQHVIMLFEAVVLAGGTANLCGFKESVRAHFNPDPTHPLVDVVTLDDPQFGITRGAVLAALGKKVENRSTSSFGYEVMDNQIREIFPIGSVLPAVTRLKFQTSSSQGNIVIRLHQADSRASQDSRDCVVGELVISGQSNDFEVEFTLNEESILQAKLINADGKKTELKITPTSAQQSKQFVLDTGNIDIVFVIDTTSSQYREIHQVKETLHKMLIQEKANQKKAGTKRVFRVGAVAYRDHDQDSAFVVKTTPLSTDLACVGDWIKSLDAKGGGDHSEAVLDGLCAAAEMNWDPQAEKKIIMICDAPPHGEKYYQGIPSEFLIDDSPKGCHCNLSEDEVFNKLNEAGKKMFEMLSDIHEGVEEMQVVKVQREFPVPTLPFLDRMVWVFEKHIKVKSYLLEDIENSHLCEFFQHETRIVSGQC